MAYRNLNAEGFEPFGFRVALPVRAGDVHTLLMQHFSEDTHARSPNADEVGCSQIADLLVFSEGRNSRVKHDRLCIHDGRHRFLLVAVPIMA